MCCSDRPTEDIGLTMPAGGIFDPFFIRDRQWDIGPQHEAHQPAWPTYPPVYQGGVTPLWLQPEYPGSRGYLHGSPPATYPLQAAMYPPRVPPEGYGGFIFGVVGNVNPPTAVGDNRTSTHNTVPGYEDPGSFPRYNMSPGGHIHLTTNISAALSQVSSRYLSQEVCHYSVWKAHWY